MLSCIALVHEMDYDYSLPTGLGLQTLALRPRSTVKHTVLDFRLSVEPGDAHVSWLEDMFGNMLARCMIPNPTRRFSIRMRSQVRVEEVNPFDFFVDGEAMRYPFRYRDSDLRNLAGYLEPLPTAGADRLLNEAKAPDGVGTVDLITRLNQKIAADFIYMTRDEAGVQTPSATIQSRKGSCRDLSWLLVALLRSLGIAARFVSGYLLQPDPGDADGDPHARADFHAWAEAYLPGAGWIGLDPTSGLLCADQHIAVAAAPHYAVAGPVQGTHGAANTSLTFRVTVEKI